ncbi:hypothetical protein [Kitasatospora indigofera]|uniref:hypothetical protein n=1 Tax=Kitasatospora indigofera TaxID=67307 RepID=UPI0036875340
MAENRGARQLSTRGAARLRAAELAEHFEAAATLRRKLAADVLVAQVELEEFAAETERRAAKLLADAEQRVARLREERAGQAAAKQAGLDALVVEMLDTDVPAKEAAERLGMTVAEVRLAKKNHDAAAAAAAAHANPLLPHVMSPFELAAAAPGGSATVPSQQDGESAEQDLVVTDGPGSAAV